MQNQHRRRDSSRVKGAWSGPGFSDRFEPNRRFVRPFAGIYSPCLPRQELTAILTFSQPPILAHNPPCFSRLNETRVNGLDIGVLYARVYKRGEFVGIQF